MSAQNKNLYQNLIHKIDRDNNMSLVRYILAFGVLISHFNILCGANIPWIVTNYDRVGGFFALSGFLLISPVLKGISYRDFVMKRIWRIIPSYFFVVILFSVLLSFISDLSFGDYFKSEGYWKYLAANLSCLNFLCPDLPGVFSDLKISAVNGALWTMKIEWQLSLTLPFVVLILKHYKFNLKKAVIFILLVSLIYRIILQVLYITTEREIYEILGRQLIGQLFYFYAGIFLYTYYEQLKKNKLVFIISSLIVYIIFRCVDYIPLYYQIGHPFVITLLVISFSLIPKDFAKYIDRGHNISYEIYLCHFPILQVLAYYNAVERIGVAASLAIGVLLTVIAAIIVYFTVGNLYLKRKKKSTIPTVSVEQ